MINKEKQNVLVKSFPTSLNFGANFTSVGQIMNFLDEFAKNEHVNPHNIILSYQYPHYYGVSIVRLETDEEQEKRIAEQTIRQDQLKEKKQQRKDRAKVLALEKKKALFEKLKRELGE